MEEATEWGDSVGEKGANSFRSGLGASSVTEIYFCGPNSNAKAKVKTIKE